MNIPNITIENYKEETISLLQRLVEFETCDPPGREVDLSRYLCAFLQQNGVAAELEEFAEGRTNIVARVPGTSNGPALVFSSHQDTVPVGTQAWKYPPFEGHIVDGRMYGRGTADMKSALAAMTISAILIAKGAPQARELILAFSAGESSNCIGAKRLLAQGIMENVGGMIIGEPSSLDLIIAEKGVIWLKVTAKGQSGHVSGSGGSNAILTMMSFLGSLQTLTFKPKNHRFCTEPTISVGIIEGGSAVNVTPDQCTAQIDIRIPPGMDHQAVVADMRGLASEAITIEMFDYKPSIETSEDHPLVALSARSVEQIRRGQPELKGVSYYSDGTILCAPEETPFVILGPGELGMSGVTDESVILENVTDAVDIYIDIAKRWGVEA